MREFEQYFSVEHAAKMLDVSSRQVRRWIASGRIPRTTMLGRRLIRIPRTALESAMRVMDHQTRVEIEANGWAMGQKKARA